MNNSIDKVISTDINNIEVKPKWVTRLGNAMINKFSIRIGNQFIESYVLCKRCNKMQLYDDINNKFMIHMCECDNVNQMNNQI